MTTPWIIMDNFFDFVDKYSLHIIGVTDIQSIKKPRKIKALLDNTGFVRKWSIWDLNISPHTLNTAYLLCF